MAIAIYSLPHRDRSTSHETALQSYRIALQKDGVTLDLGGTLSAATKNRLDRVSVPVGNTGIMLMLRVKDAPVNVARSLSVFLPLLMRSEEHTSELQSLMRTSYAVFCLKKTNIHTNPRAHLYERQVTDQI